MRNSRNTSIKKEQKIKLFVNFDLDDNIDEAIEQLNNKEIIF